MLKGLIALFVCVSVNSRSYATNFFLTGPKEVLAFCESVTTGLIESELELIDSLLKKGFTCKNVKNIEGTEIIFCADVNKNHLIAGIAKDKASRLNGFMGLMELFVKTNQPLPKFN